MIRVLIVSEWFEPQNAIGAVRPSKLAKYLAQMGYKVDVFTSRIGKPDIPYEPAGFRVIYDSNSIYVHAETPNQKSAAPKTQKSKLRQELSMICRQIISYRSGKAFLNKFIAAVQTGEVVLTEYDCLFTTFGPVSAVLIGRYIKRQVPNIKWINDFRDPMVSQIMPRLFRTFYQYLQRQSIRECDFVTTVSGGYKKRLAVGCPEKKIVVIPNGYDSDDRKIIEQCNKSHQQFSMTYAGSLYEGKRNLSPLFKMLKSLCDTGSLRKEEIAFHYAGGDFGYLYTQAQTYGMESILVDHGKMPHNACMEMQASSRFLVLSTWNEIGEEGVFPGKLVEYMLMQRPIISVIDGGLAHSEVTETLHTYRLGESVEEADAQSYQILYRWLERQAQAYRNGAPALFQVDQRRLDERFNWTNIAKQFANLMEAG